MENCFCLLYEPRSVREIILNTFSKRIHAITHDNLFFFAAFPSFAQFALLSFFSSICYEVRVLTSVIASIAVEIERISLRPVF